MMMKTILTLALMAFAFPAISEQSKPPPTVVMTINLYDAQATLPIPPWVTGTDIAGQSEVWNQKGVGPHGRDMFIQEFIPKGQKFESWDKIYAILAETPYTQTLKDYMVEVNAPFEQACNDFAISHLLDRPDAIVYLGFCPSYKNDPSKGEVVIMGLRIFEDTVMRFYYEGRGKSFPKVTANMDTSLLPIPDKDIRLMIQKIADIGIKPK